MILFLVPAFLLALAYGAVWTLRPVSLARSVVKTGSTALLALGALWAGLPWIALALGLGALGDWFLSRDREVGFLPGLGVFALGHAVYLGVLWPVAGMPGALAFGVLLLAALGLMLRLWPVLGGLRGPVAVYAGLSVALGAMALGLPEGAGWLMAGVLAFIASDMVLALSLFLLGQDHRLQPVLARTLWALYWGGQAAILWGAKTLLSGIDGAAGIA